MVVGFEWDTEFELIYHVELVLASNGVTTFELETALGSVGEFELITYVK